MFKGNNIINKYLFVKKNINNCKLEQSNNDDTFKVILNDLL